MATVFLNGRFVDQDEAKVSALDAGFQHGVGLFETMTSRIDGGTAIVFRLGDHLDRIIASALELGLADQLRRAALGEAVAQTAERAWRDTGLERARLRLTITGGDLNLLSRPRTSPDGGRPARPDPTLLIVAQPATDYPPDMFERGVAAVIANLRVNPLNPFEGHKTLNYWWRLRELQRAATAQAGEALVFQVTNYLAGGCVSNAFVVKDGELVTPIARGEEEEVGGRGAVPSPVLPGVTRKFVIEQAAERGLKLTRRMVSIEDVLKADEVFLTNSSFGVLPVVKVERETIAAGEPGGLTAALRQAWVRANGADAEN